MIINILSMLENLSLVDYIFFFTVVFLMILVVSLIYFIKVNKDDEVVLDNLDLNNPDDLKTLVNNIKPSNKTIELTSYEAEQENKAIISYDELIKNKSGMGLHYEGSPADDVLVKKIDLSNFESNPNEIRQEVPVLLMSIKKEEEFLRTLKELQTLLN